MGRKQHIEIARRIKASLDQSIDSLPYTKAFELVYIRFCEEACEALDRNYVWCALLAVRKNKQDRAAWPH